MAPSAMSNDRIYGVRMDPKLACEIHLPKPLLEQVAYCLDLPRVQLGFAVLHPKRLPLRAIVGCVLHVFGVRNVFQILHGVIAWVHVAVIDFVAFWARTNECCSHELMHEKRSVPIICTQRHAPVSTTISSRSKNASDSRTSCLTDTSNVTTARHLIKPFITDNWKPAFNPSLFAHLLSLSHRHVLGELQWQE